MSVLMFSVGLEKPSYNCFLNVYVKSMCVEQSDLFGLLQLMTSCFWQSHYFHFSSNFALVALSLCFPGIGTDPQNIPLLMPL